MISSQIRQHYCLFRRCTKASADRWSRQSLHSWKFRQVGLHALRAAVHGGHAGAADLDQAERLHDGDELVELGSLAGDFEDEMFGVGVDDAGAESVRQAQ